MRIATLSSLSLVLVALGSQGCASWFQRGSSGSSSSSSGYTGTVTVENRSQLSVCSIAAKGTEEGTETTVQLGPGQTATFEAARTIRYLQLTECETGRLLYGNPLAWLNDREGLGADTLTVGRVVLRDPGGSTSIEGGALSVSLVPMDANDALREAFFAVMARRQTDDRVFMADSDLASQLLTLIRNGGRGQGWREDFQAAVITWNDWSTLTRRDNVDGRWADVPVGRELTYVAGARWPGGACTIQSFSARQAFDGETASGPIGHGGIGAQFPIPCSLLTAMGQYPNAATAQ